MKKVFLFVLLLYGFPMPANAADHMVKASYYGHDFEGKTMANGKPFRAKDPTTAAHQTLPFGTKLLVKNPENGRKLVVTVKDRGPFKKGRKLDLSRAAAKQLGYAERGVALLEMSVISVGNKN